MTRNEAFFQALLSDPNDATLRLVYADWLEDHSDPTHRACGELLRLTETLIHTIDLPNRPALEERQRRLLAQGAPPVGPFWTNAAGIRFAWVPAGTFLMGSPEGEEGRGEEEWQHRVTLSRGYYLSAHPVTQWQWQAVMGSNPSRFPGDDLPVDNVSREACLHFCERLREIDDRPYRLPSEAEWEFACRAGTTGPFSFGPSISTEQANFAGYQVYGQGAEGEFRRQTTPVGRFPGNAFGLYDMHGNVWEWCADLFGPYSHGDVRDPRGAILSTSRVARGGSWLDGPRFCRSACRGRRTAGYRLDSHGCRVCLSWE
jgi:uncharacterized protein (TIGR02996 family)